jgi:hypothetical protein
LKIIIINVDNDPIRTIEAIGNGPTIDPIPPRRIKSPPPIPSSFFNNLYIKFIDHKKKYQEIKPIKDNEILEIFKKR